MQDSYLKLKQIILKNSLKWSICNTHTKKVAGGRQEGLEMLRWTDREQIISEQEMFHTCAHPRKVLKNSTICGSLIKAPLNENLGYTAPRAKETPRKCIYPSWKRPVTCTTADNNQLVLFTWVLSSKAKSHEKWEAMSIFTALQVLYQPRCSPGRRHREGRGCASPCQQSPAGQLGGDSDYLTRISLFVLPPAPSQWSSPQSQWLPGAKPRPKSRLAHSSLLC